MKQIVSAAIAALFAIVTFSAPAADVTAPADTPKAEKKTTKKKKSKSTKKSKKKADTETSAPAPK